tara:strand:+ start:319 stop:840 length:522 start_codon:yes stop_codon:yes gene_type:complete
MKEEKKSGRYLKMLEDNANGSPFLKDTYHKIEEDDMIGTVSIDGYCFGGKNYLWERSEVELMPKEFEPYKKQNKMKTLQQRKVIEWAEERGLIKKENATKQFMKLTEEVGELANAILKKDPYETIDAIGDIQVVLIILCEQLDLNINKCLESAYDEIKDRKGKTVNGTFIKEQ